MALAAQRLLRHLEMKRELPLALLLARIAADRAPRAVSPLAERLETAARAHVGVPNKVCMIATIWSQDFFSVASWRRPAAVIE